MEATVFPTELVNWLSMMFMYCDMYPVGTEESTVV